uniref:Uncharacterized protein n=1 Tax=Arundo donax TaxID=35708 RepID=A0A0A9ER59_ARUDO
MEKSRSSFKDSFKATNQEMQFQKTANNCGKSTDSCNEVVEVESALRHKAKLERQQRTAERAAKALAEKNMRDMLAQREQAERHVRHLVIRGKKAIPLFLNNLFFSNIDFWYRGWLNSLILKSSDGQMEK